MSVLCQGSIIPVDIAEEDDTLESDDDVASLSEEVVLSDDSSWKWQWWGLGLANQ